MSPSKIAVVTGATQGLGLALAEGLAGRLGPDGVVYLTGRDADRVARAVASLRAGAAEVRGEVLDVADPASVTGLADRLRQRHGGVDVVFSNAVMRIGPDDDAPAIIDEYVDVNNFGTSRVLRAFGPLLRADGRLLVVASSLGTLYQLAPALHQRFDGADTVDAVDAQIAAWRDEVRDGRALGMAWPGFVNIPSKIGQVAAVRALAGQRRTQDAERGILIASVCPGMMNTPTSALWWDVSGAPTPAQAAAPLLDLVFDPVKPERYGELIRHGAIVPWRP